MKKLWNDIGDHIVSLWITKKYLSIVLFILYFFNIILVQEFTLHIDIFAPYIYTCHWFVSQREVE